MAREIKFRAWNVRRWLRDNEWGLTPDGSTLIYDEQEDNWVAQNKEHPIFDLKVCQFTGLKDKNGKEVYEDDLLLIPDTYKERILDDGSGPVEPANHISQVVFENNSFGVVIKERGEDLHTGYWSFERLVVEIGFTGVGEFEVIGNIYENPELVSG